MPQEPGGKSAILIPVWVAVLSLVGGVLSTAIQGYFNSQLEKDKAQSSLILKAIETGNVKDSATNLRFLIEAGLLEDPSGRITALLNKPGGVPKLPISSARISVESTQPGIVSASSTDNVELACQDPANSGDTVRLGIDGSPLPAIHGRARLPALTPGSHSLWWSVDTPSATRICEVVVNGNVQYSDQAFSGSGSFLLQVK